MNRVKPLAKLGARGRKRLGPPASGRNGPSLAPKTLNAVVCLLLAGATIALYSPIVGYPFVVLDDDHDYVTANPHVHGGLAWSTVKWAFTTRLRRRTGIR